MAVSDIEAINQATLRYLQAVRNGEEAYDVDRARYYGYVDADMFDCPDFVLFTNNDNPIVNYILKDGTFEPYSLKLWCHLCRSATGVVDIGAHVGVYSLAAALLRPDIAVHAIEPNPYANSRLRMHKAINGAANIVEHAYAVGDEDKITEFSAWLKADGNISSGGSVGKTTDPRAEQSIVKMIRLDNTNLDSLLGDKPLIKIDVEGAEAAVFSGMEKILALKPDIILETFSRDACDALNPRLRDFGYLVYQIKESEMSAVAQNKLVPADADTGHDFNQYLSVRPFPTL